MSTRFSIIIPAFNEARYLPRLLDSIRTAADIYGAERIETIVADNCSTDDTADIARWGGCTVARVGKRCIASARNGGAAIATGEVLCFIDADSAIHPDTFARIDAAIQDPTVVAGATGIYLERMSPGLRVVYCAMLPFVWLTDLDTGVVFCRRQDFDAVGGYDENMLLAEDVDFLFKLKRLGRGKGQKLRRLKGVQALGCTRKFDEHGDWHYFALLPQVIKSIWRCGFRIAHVQEQAPEITDYWYQPNR